MAWRFEPGEPLGDAFRRVAGEEIAKVRAGLTDPASEPAKAIHEARQGFKRLRALLRLAEPSLGKAFEEENGLWREAGRQLSGSRDQTVLRESFDKIVGGCRSGLPRKDLACLRRKLVADGPRSGGSDVAEHLRAVIALLDDAEMRLASLDWPGDEMVLAQGLKRSQARLRKNWTAARQTAEPQALHEWRNRVKDQAAQMRLFRQVVPPALRDRHGDEKKTAELLGEEHDFWMLAERLAAGPVPTEAAQTCQLLLDEIGERRKALRQQALKLGKGFSSQKPKAFASKLAAAWEKPPLRRGKVGAAKFPTSQAS